MKVIKSTAKFNKKHPGLTLVSAVAAASMAGVHYNTIWYHIHTSKRVRSYFNIAAERVYVVWEDVVELYPETVQGVKQARNADANRQPIKTEYDVLTELIAEYGKKSWNKAHIEDVLMDLENRLTKIEK